MHVRRLLGVSAGLLACLVLAGFASARPQIVGGTTAPPSSWPSVAFVHSSYGSKDYGCTGVVVAPEWVVTAAHCAYGDRTHLATAISAVLGVKDYTDPERTIIAVDRFVIAPDYDAERDLHDVAMLHLSSPTTVPAMRLATRAEYGAGRYVSLPDVPNAAGWGTTDVMSTRLTVLLREAYLRIRPTSECREFASFDEATQTCAGTEGKAGACHGDSGGPLVSFDAATREPVLWGLTSYGPQADRRLDPCSLDVPVVFSWVPAFADFIQATAGVAPPPPPVEPTPTPLPGPSGPVAPPPVTPPAAACVTAQAKLISARSAEKSALKHLRTLRRHHASRTRIKRASTRYHARHAKRVVASAAVGRACR